MCAYQGARNFSFSKNFAYVLNELSLKSVSNTDSNIFDEILNSINNDCTNATKIRKMEHNKTF